MNEAWTGKDGNTLSLGDVVETRLGPRGERVFTGTIVVAEEHRLGGTAVTLAASSGETVMVLPEWCSAHRPGTCSA